MAKKKVSKKKVSKKKVVKKKVSKKKVVKKKAILKKKVVKKKAIPKTRKSPVSRRPPYRFKKTKPIDVQTQKLDKICDSLEKSVNAFLSFSDSLFVRFDTLIQVLDHNLNGAVPEKVSNSDQELEETVAPETDNEEISEQVAKVEPYARSSAPAPTLHPLSSQYERQEPSVVPGNDRPFQDKRTDP